MGRGLGVGVVRPAGVPVAVGVAVGVTVGVAVAVAVGVAEGDAVGVGVGVRRHRAAGKHTRRDCASTLKALWNRGLSACPIPSRAGCHSRSAATLERQR